MRSVLAAIVLIFAVLPAMSQTTAPQPVVRSTLNPVQVVVGQPATLVVEVLAPNYMTKPPVMPDFQIRNAITRTASTLNMSDQQGDVSYAGIRYEFLIYPQEAGLYVVPAQSITVTFADNPPHTVQTEVPVAAINFQAVIPDAASDLNPFVSATGLSLQQEFRPSSNVLKVGDAITRIVTIKAEGAPAMLLPPPTFAPVAGARIYRSAPRLNDRFDQRADTLTSTRTDSATYMLEAAGTVTLPALDVAWWNAKDQKIDRVRAESQSFTVTGGVLPSRAASEQGGLSAPRRFMLFVLEHWLAVLSAVIVLAVLIWMAPPVLRYLDRYLRQQREAYRRSEAFAFRELRRVARRGDTRLTYRALLLWLSRFEPAAPSGTVRALTSFAKDPTLTHEIAALEHQLFAAVPPSNKWSGGPLISAIGSARAKAGLQRREGGATHSLPDDINPRPSIVGLQQLSRPVAR